MAKANLNDVLQKTQELNWKIKELLKLSTYNDYDDMSGLEMNLDDAEQIFLYDELRGIMDRLADVENKISYISRPIKTVGKLYKNSSGRYETAQGYVYTCGNGIEALITDDGGYREVPFWARTRVEAANGEYYLVGFKQQNLDGLMVRIRKLD